ncbi:MAG: ribonuclease III domain-containing protein [Lachnospiraceae bacterium]|nr:ribonuclease III domain-containing protein [Lachnospiraceae bacterium]MDO4805465.1 ribonuclease III domain-containing protein [Lachnospiraceae bacterium]
MSEAEARTYAPLTLAFLGDAVYELAVRTMLVQRGDMRPNELNRRSSLLARAHAQSQAMEKIEPLLDETEADIYRRGRNAKSNTMAKNATVGDYRRATGFEALIGYLYLAGKRERVLELIEIAVNVNGQ